MPLEHLHRRAEPRDVRSAQHAPRPAADNPDRLARQHLRRYVCTTRYLYVDRGWGYC